MPRHPLGGLSSVGRAPALQAGCQEFESPRLHPVFIGSPASSGGPLSSPGTAFDPSRRTPPPPARATLADRRQQCEDGVGRGGPTRIDRTCSRPARRRRTGYLIAAMAAMAAYTFVASLAIVGASGAPPVTPAAAAEQSAEPDATDDANIVAAWSRLRVGWIYVYGDGRVVLRHDNGRLLTSEGSVSFGVIQRRLSPFGLQLV